MANTLSMSEHYGAEGQKWRLTLTQQQTVGQHYCRINGATLFVNDFYYTVVCIAEDGLDELWISSQMCLIDGDYKCLGTTAHMNVTDPQIQVGNVIGKEHKFKIPNNFEPISDKLTLLVEISILKGVGDTWHKIKVPSCSLRDDIKAAIDFEGDMEGKDITLVAKLHEQEKESINVDSEGSKFGAHKFILAARSPVFAAMFKHSEMKENEKNEVEITDIQPAVLKEMLTFIYTGDTPNIKEMASSLLYAAEKYQLQHLKALSERQLAVSITVKNAAETLVLAHQHEALQLKEITLNFIAVNGRRVMKSEGWESVKAFGSDLVTEVLDTIYNSSDVEPPAKREKLEWHD